MSSFYLKFWVLLRWQWGIPSGPAEMELILNFLNLMEKYGKWRSLATVEWVTMAPTFQQHPKKSRIRIDNCQNNHVAGSQPHHRGFDEIPSSAQAANSRGMVNPTWQCHAAPALDLRVKASKKKNNVKFLLFVVQTSTPKPLTKLHL